MPFNHEPLTSVQLKQPTLFVQDQWRVQLEHGVGAQVFVGDVREHAASGNQME